jgi:HAD superfamily hydrolase (TIGR01459 family)
MSFKILPGLAEVADHYDAFILDLWGVVHNGQEPYPGALDCMARLRESGRQVLLLSNAPRTHNHVIAFLEGIGVPADSYDHILTSGDMTRQALIQKDHLFIKDAGSRFYQIGALRDKGIDDGLEYSQVFDLKSADFIICTGLVEDETEDPEDYRALLSEALSFNLPMLCANPDLTVCGDQKPYIARALLRRCMNSSVGG